MSAPDAMTATKKGLRKIAATVSLLCLASYAVGITGCADAYYVDATRAPEARYNTYHAPYYYPYYPWYGYYGGAYYYDY